MKVEQTEAQIQKAIVEYLTLRNILFFSVPNELAGGNAGGRMRRFVAMGLRAGVSDLLVVLEGRVIFVEVKTPKGRLSEHQRFFRAKVTELGHRYEVVRSVCDMEKVLLR